MTNNDEKEYIKFDTIKIKTNKEYLLKTFIPFNTSYSKGIFTGEYYNSKNDKSIPYNLYIGISHAKQTLTLEFSSKILLDDYPRLITKQTFKKCLENINALGICKLDIEAISKHCFVTKCHITHDIAYQLTDNSFKTLNQCVNNYRRFKWEHYQGNGVRFTSDVSSQSKNCKESIVIYNKEIEIVKNDDFLKSVKKTNSIVDYFRGKTRFEMELNTKNKICKFLNIESNHINKVFNSNTNPLLCQFNKVFGNADEVKSQPLVRSYEEYAMLAIIDVHKGDLKKIEQNMKDREAYSSKSRELRNRMKKIERLCANIHNEMCDSNNILLEFREKLS